MDSNQFSMQYLYNSFALPLLVLLFLNGDLRGQDAAITVDSQVVAARAFFDRTESADSAITVLRAALARVAREGTHKQAGELYYLLSEAAYLLPVVNKDTAIYYLEESVTAYRRAQDADEELIGALARLSSRYQTLQFYRRAERPLLEAVTLAESTNDVS